MPSNDQQNWHGLSESDSADLTVRHPDSHLQIIRAWAEQNNLIEIVETIALAFAFAFAFAFGFTENPYAHQLNRFRFAYSQSIELPNNYAGYPPRHFKREY